MQIHTVVQGDTLRSIAEKYGTTVRELLHFNELETQDVLVPGLHLLVPGTTQLVQPYNVRQGDTIESIARKIGISNEVLANWTGLEGANAAKNLTPGTTLYLPKPLTAKKSIEVNGYLLPTGTDSDASILQDVSLMTYLSIFSYQARADGTLVAPSDKQALKAAKQYRIAPLMTVTNFDGNNFNTELAHTILANASIRRRLIETILKTLSNNGFRGVNVDFEHMRPGDRALYNQFIQELGDSVRAKNFSISIAMGPKTSDDPQASWMGAFDYRTLGSEVDFLMLMTYEWGWVGGPPMAIK